MKLEWIFTVLTVVPWLFRSISLKIKNVNKETKPKTYIVEQNSEISCTPNVDKKTY